MNSSLLGRLLILSVLSALLVNLQSAFYSGVARISQLACFMALAAIALGSFRLVLDIGQNTVDQMVSFMMGMLPQMLVLVAGMGNVHTVATLFRSNDCLHGLCQCYEEHSISVNYTVGYSEHG